MPTSIITNIERAGGFDLDDGGYMFTNRVTFQDGNYGTANTKTEVPPYRVGDTMDYAITGNHRGTPKFKITKPGGRFGAPQQPSPAQPPQPPRQPPQSPPMRPNVPAIIPVNGATVGMAMNQAIALLTRDLTHDEVIMWVREPGSWRALAETASDIIRVSRHLESGHLAPSVKDRAAGNVGQQAPQPPPPPQQELDEDVPF